jgi:hypothetical protein
MRALGVYKYTCQAGAAQTLKVGVEKIQDASNNCALPSTGIYVICSYSKSVIWEISQNSLSGCSAHLPA